MSWLLLIYTVPAQPSAKRATVWREVKRAGAVYLRDGVCALPERKESLIKLREIAGRVEELGGNATLVRSAELDDGKSEALREGSRQARRLEYADLGQEIAAFKAHIRQEGERRDFTFRELEELESDLGKLRRWLDQISARDFEENEAAHTAQEQLDRCEEQLQAFLEKTYEQEEASS